MNNKNVSKAREKLARLVDQLLEDGVSPAEIESAFNDIQYIISRAKQFRQSSRSKQ